MASLTNNPFKRFKKARKMEGKLDGQAVHALMKRKSANWIQGAIKKPGALHKELGVKTGKKIPAKMLSNATNAGGKLGQRARLAETLKGMKHGKSSMKKKASGRKEPTIGFANVERKASKKRKSTVSMSGNVEMKSSKRQKSAMCKCKSAMCKHSGKK